MQKQRLIVFLGALLLAAAPGWAQTQVDSTTFSAAVDNSQTTVFLTAASGAAVDGFLYVDGELMRVTSVSGTTIGVRRGHADGNTPARAHTITSTVWVGAGEEFDTFNVSGACTQADEQYAPHINTQERRFFDCNHGVWIERDPQLSHAARASFFLDRLAVRDEFNQGYAVMQDDGTAKSVTDDEDNHVAGSPLGPIEYREELGKTTSSWVTIDGVLDVSADDTTDNEGVEIVFATAMTTNDQVLEAGTNGGCISALIDIADISGTDSVHIGWRQNEDFVDAADYMGYTIANAVGVNATDGSIVSSQAVSEATDTDDSGVDWADGEERALKVCISAAGVPTAFYSDDAPNTDNPVYNAITMTETGSTLTAGTGLVPYFVYLAAGTDGADVTVRWVQLEWHP